MGCFSSKQQVLLTSSSAISALYLDHNLTDFENAKLTIDALELIPAASNLDDDDDRCHSKSFQSDDDNKSTIERCASFHTVDEYDALIQKISNNKKEISIGTNEDDDERGVRRKKIGEALAGSLNVEFQTVGSLRQWLDDHVNSLGGGGGGGGDGGVDFPTPKFGSYYDNNSNFVNAMDSVFVEISSKHEEENVPEVDPDLVAAFEEHMQQLEVEEDDILKLIEAVRGR